MLVFQMNLITFFINVGTNIENNILKKNYEKLNWKNSNPKCHINNSIFLAPITRDEIEKYLLKV